MRRNRTDVFLSLMRKRIAQKKAMGKDKTMENYMTAYRSFNGFLQWKRKRGDLLLEHFTEGLVLEYERYLLIERRVTRNTSSFYMRILRTIYRSRHNPFPPEDPFRHVYTGIDFTRKRAIDMGLIVKLADIRLEERELELARDIFIFCFLARGMAFIDLVKLRKQDLSDGRITYYRSKTGRLLSVKVEKEMQEILNRYTCADSCYLFPIMKGNHFDQTAYEAALRLYNYNLARLSDLSGCPGAFSSYVPRHTWASVAKRMNVPLSVISESLGHSNERVTAIYLSSLDAKDIDAANRKVLRGLEERLQKKIR